MHLLKREMYHEAVNMLDHESGRDASDTSNASKL